MHYQCMWILPVIEKETENFLLQICSASFGPNSALNCSSHCNFITFIELCGRIFGFVGNIRLSLTRLLLTASAGSPEVIPEKLNFLNNNSTRTGDNSNLTTRLACAAYSVQRVQCIEEGRAASKSPH
jgi:hypothetical protein